jgi:hypothetical protein
MASDVPGELLPLGPHAKAAPPPYKRNPPSPRTLTLLLHRPKIPSTAAPFFLRSGHLGLTVVRPLRRALGHHSPHKSSTSPPRSFPSRALEP